MCYVQLLNNNTVGKLNNNVKIIHKFMKNIKVSLCSVPVEGWGVRLDRKRSEGSLGIMPKVAIVSLVDAMKKAGFPKSSYDFYDIDMLYPSDEEVRKYFVSQKPDVVGLSAVVSTSYSQVKKGIIDQGIDKAIEITQTCLKYLTLLFLSFDPGIFERDI